MNDLIETNKHDVSNHIFILIHGTWARNRLLLIPFFKRGSAQWCKRGSKLRQYIKDALDEDVEFQVFNWSGANNPIARQNAVEDLINYIEELRKKSNKKIHLITHSHAGNVALHASQDRNIENEISSLVCLSTPFLHTNQRKWGDEDKKNLKPMYHAFKVLFLVMLSTIFLLSTAINFGLGYLGLSLRIPEYNMFSSKFIGIIDWSVSSYFSVVSDLLTSIPVFQIIGGAIVLFIIFLYILLKESKLITNWFLNKCLLIFHNLSLPKSVPFPVLIIRGTADEASSVLGFSQLISSVFTKFLRLYLYLLSKRGKKQQQKLGKTLLYISIALSVFYVFFNVNPTPDYIFPVLCATFGVSFWWLPSILSFFAVPIILCLTLLIGITLLPFGWQFLIAGIGMQISAESTPPGKWTLTHVTPNLKDNHSLRHFTHSDSNALIKVSSWLKNEFGNSSQAQAEFTESE